MENEKHTRHQSGMPTAHELMFYEAAERAWHSREEGPDSRDMEIISKMAGEIVMEPGEVFDIQQQAPGFPRENAG